MKISFILPAKSVSRSNEQGIRRIDTHLSKLGVKDYEILLVPNHPPDTESVSYLKSQFLHLRVVDPAQVIGKGSAVKQGVLASQGDLVFMTDCDAPFGLDFIDRALAELKNGCDFISANRRLKESHFIIPADLMGIAYRRHLLGRLYNFVLRKAFGLHSGDTQAGMKAMSRRFAITAFSIQQCTGFHFDIELFIIKNRQGFKWVEIPVTLRLESEKSTVRIFKEGISFIYWLARILWNDFRGIYAKSPKTLPLLEKKSN